MRNDTPKNDRLSCGLSGRNLDAALKKAGISRYRLAKDLGISYRIVQYWAKGRRPSAAMAERVAAYLGIQTVPLDDHTEILARLSRIEERLGIEKVNISLDPARLKIRWPARLAAEKEKGES